MKTYMNIDTGELWTEEEVRQAYGQQWELHDEYPTFEGYMDHLLALGRQRIGGLAEVTGYVVRDREAGNVIERFVTEEAAEEARLRYEESDFDEQIFEESFYEVAPIID